MSATSSRLGNFPELFSAQSVGAKGAVYKKRAFERFSGMGIPTTRHEDWKYTSLNHLSKEEHELRGPGELPAKLVADLSVPNAHQIVLVNGKLMSGQDSLPTGVTLGQVGDLELDDEGVTEPMELLGLAFHRDGLALEVKAGVQVEGPVQLIHLQLGPGNGASFARHHLTLNPKSSLDLIETYHAEAGVSGFSHQQVQIQLGEGASINHVRQQVNAGAVTDINTTRATVAKDARYDVFTFTNGGRLVRNNLHVQLLGEHAHTSLLGLYALKSSQHVDHFTTIDHKVPDATSEQVYRGIVDDQSRAVFTGKIFVRQGAQRTVANQSNKNLLLSSEAEVDTRPQLQIDADDVKCSHGATVGQLNEQELFYLKTRGIREKDARRMLSEGFADAVMTLCPIDGVKAKLKQNLRGYFNG
jgi:Fe-S cluster assembly protein SufD